VDFWDQFRATGVMNFAVIIDRETDRSASLFLLNNIITQAVYDCWWLKRKAEADE